MSDLLYTFIVKKVAGTLGIDPKVISNTIEPLYNDPKRKYHNMDHLFYMFTMAGPYLNTVQTLSVLFHDAIYDVAGKDNEKQSAEMAYGWCHSNNGAEYAVDVYQYVISTKHNGVSRLLAERDKDLAWFLDLDLLILADNDLEYRRYAEKVKQEYTFGGRLTSNQYDEGRLKFLESLLKSPIYNTDVCKSCNEPIAKKNIANEIERIKVRLAQ